MYPFCITDVPIVHQYANANKYFFIHHNPAIICSSTTERERMALQGQPESIAKVIHNKKEAKKKQKANSLKPIDLKDNRTIGEGSTEYINSQMSDAPEVEGLSDNRSDKPSRTRNQIKNFQIDELLYGMIDEGLIDPKYMGFFAKACHQLGTSKVNMIAINSRNGLTPQKLFAYKIKGALSLHYKREYNKLNDTL